MRPGLVSYLAFLFQPVFGGKFIASQLVVIPYVQRVTLKRVQPAPENEES